MERFTIFRSTFDALLECPPDVLKKAFEMIGRYAMDGELPTESGMAYAMFLSVKPIIDTSLTRSGAGRSGGSVSKQTTSKPEANVSKPQANASKLQANVSKVEANASKPEQKIKDKREKINNINSLSENLSADTPSEYPYKEIVDYLNEKAGTAFKDKSKDTRRHISARLSEGFSVDDFKKVIDGRVLAWKSDPKMQEYLRPSTLFGTKFESYLNAPDIHPQEKNFKPNMFHNFTQRDYDFADLERQLINGQG